SHSLACPEAAASCSADAIGESAHECLALLELLQRDPLVGLMRLGDVSGPADDRRDAGVVKQRCFAAEGYLADLARSAEQLSQLAELAAAVSIEAGQGRELLELDESRGIHGMHLGEQRGGETLELREKLVRIVERQVAELEVELAVARDDIDRSPA